MASGRKSTRKVKEEPAEPEPEEVEEEEEDGQQEDESLEAEAEGGPEDEDGEPPPRRTAKTRAPRRSATAPAPRQKPARKGPAARRDPRQPSLFSREGQEKGSRKVTRAIGSILLSLLGIAGLFVLFQFFAGSRFFALRGVDVIWPAAKPGVAPILSAGDVEDLVSRLPAVERGVLRADLEVIRKELKKNPLMREVEVARLLPDRLRVSVIERQPVALARRSDSSLACVDDDGVMFGSASNWRVDPTPPPINGLAEGGEDATAMNRHWLMIYKRLMAELDYAEPKLSSNIDEIFFDKGDVVRLMLTERRGWVLIGSEDFRTRLNVALDILAAISRKDLEALNVLKIGDAERLLNGKINYVNVNDPKRPVIGLDE
jgi:cell division septal protein FtsQ